MVRRLYSCFIFLMLLAVAPRSVAQTLGEDIILTSTFEQYQDQWTTQYSSTPYTEVKGEVLPLGATGAVIKLIPRVALVSYSDEDKRIYLANGSKYILSFLHKGLEGGGTPLTVQVQYYGDYGVLGTKNFLPAADNIADKSPTTSDEWQVGWLNLENIPATASAVVIKIIALRGKPFLLSNIQMRPYTGTTPEAPKIEGAKPTLSSPTNLRLLTYQREVELSWAAVSGMDVSYEVQIDGTTVQTTTDTKALLTGLTPGKSHKFSIVAKSGGISSLPTTREQATQSLSEDTDISPRIPYLRTVPVSDKLPSVGLCPATIGLYYNDLTNPNATIRYYIDDVVYEPQGRSLTFPSSGVHRLRVLIDEGEGVVWELEYNLNIKS